MTIAQPAGGNPGRPFKSQPTATGGIATSVPIVIARAASASGFSEAFSRAFQPAWNTAANKTSGKTARGTRGV